MMYRATAAAALLLALGSLVDCQVASAQIVNPQMPQLTPQMQTMMQMRALQGYSRRGVQTGYPQMNPYGNGGFFDDPGGFVNDDYVPRRLRNKSTSQKRAQSRPANEQQKKTAKNNAAKGKKAKPASKDADAGE